MKTIMLNPLKYLVTFVLLLSMVQLTSCCKHTDNSTGSITILGSWNWVKTYGGFTGGEETPASTGKEKALIFYENGVYVKTVFKAIEKSGTYVFGYDTTTHRQFIQFDNEPPQNIDILTSSMLDYGSAPADGISHRYTRTPIR